MKLEKFSKNTRQKKIIIGAIVGLILLVGGITLYRAFALYEEKKEFNVLRGKVPDFTNKEDIRFAVIIDGESKTNFPKKNTGYVYTGYDCNDKEVSIEWSNEKWAPTVLNLNTKGTNCTLKFDYVPNNLYEKVSIGDYISYTPNKTSYKIETNLTGYWNEQEIYPSELNLWRVIKKNEDGTVDIISEYVSSTDVWFHGKVGYEKFIGSLNTIAKQYETEGITVASRPIGYSGQSSTVSVSSTLAPWTNTTNEINSPNQSAREKAGGGDYGYIEDYNLVKKAFGWDGITADNSYAIANKVGATKADFYWLTSRYYTYTNSTHFYYSNIAVSPNGDINRGSIYYYESSWISNTNNATLRPIVTLNSTIQVTEGEMNNKSLWIVN